MKHEVALAILYRDESFLLQLRDNVPGIVYPGYWGFFGGHLESGETPEMAVVREIREEIGYDLPSVAAFRRHESEGAVRHIFHAPLEVEVSDLALNEGWDFALWTVADVRAGERYSDRAGQVRPLGKPHQQILLDFIASSWGKGDRP